MGGYQIIDFVGIDLKDGGSNLLIYNLLNNTTRKVILGTSLVYDNIELKDEYFTCEVDGTSFVLKNASFSITVANDGTITCEKTSSGGNETIVFESLASLLSYLDDEGLVGNVSGIYNVFGGNETMGLFKTGTSGGDVVFQDYEGTDLDFTTTYDTITYIAYNTKLHLINIIGEKEK